MNAKRRHRRARRREMAFRRWYTGCCQSTALGDVYRIARIWTPDPGDPSTFVAYLRARFLGRGQ